MKVSTHFLSSVLLVSLLFPFYGWKSFIVIIGGVLVDIDHYFLYILKFKSYNFRDAYDYFSNTDYKVHHGSFFFFHSLELLLFFVVLSFRYELALIFAMGILLHYILDLIYEVTTAGHTVKSWLFTWWAIKKFRLPYT